MQLLKDTRSKYYGWENVLSKYIKLPPIKQFWILRAYYFVILGYHHSLVLDITGYVVYVRRHTISLGKVLKISMVITFTTFLIISACELIWLSLYIYSIEMIHCDLSDLFTVQNARPILALSMNVSW